MLPDRIRGLCAGSITPHNRALRPLAVLVAIYCCLSAVSGQWLETTISLPDSLVGLAALRYLVYDSPFAPMAGETSARVSPAGHGIGTRS